VRLVTGTEGRPLRLTARVRRGIALLLGDEDVSGDQLADELALARARAWLRDIMHRSEAGLRPRVRPGRNQAGRT
jgi:hypothetical protein